MRYTLPVTVRTYPERVTVLVEINIDSGKLANTLGLKAAANRTGKARALHGAISAKVIRKEVA